MFRQHIVKYYKFDGYVIENGIHQYVYFHTPIKFFVRFSTLSFENIFGHWACHIAHSIRIPETDVPSQF